MEFYLSEFAYNRHCNNVNMTIRQSMKLSDIENMLIWPQRKYVGSSKFCSALCFRYCYYGIAVICIEIMQFYFLQKCQRCHSNINFCGSSQ